MNIIELLDKFGIPENLPTSVLGKVHSFVSSKLVLGFRNLTLKLLVRYSDSLEDIYPRHTCEKHLALNRFPLLLPLFCLSEEAHKTHYTHTYTHTHT